ncbi:hypothetical protein B566_EDAN001970 [Ephemera danica]|nr:hypothetical protein B566_EDAN001970 [Ephemera danica]
MRLRHLGDYYTHVCPVCDARVKLKSAFIEHMRAHTGERPFACTVPNCSASFACLGRLNTHLRTIHGPRQFTCPTCDKNFACNMQGNLTKHIRTMHARPDFSLRKYKNNQQRAMDDKVPKSRKSWKAKGQEAVKQYLSVLSQKLGRMVTVEELRAQEEHRKKQMNIIKEKAMRERINKITLKEHSYVQQPPKSPSPVPSTLEPISSNIYMEAMIAANLDFSSTALAELPDLSDPIPRPLLVTCNLEAAADYANAGFILPDATEDKMDPLLSNYSDVLHVPASLGLEPYSVGPTLVEVPGLFVQFPSGEKLQLNLNMLRDSQLLDMTPGMVGEPLPAPSMPLAQIEGLLPSSSTEFLPSVMIVVSDPADPLASS